MKMLAVSATVWLVMVVVITVVDIGGVKAGVTNEDIRVAILQIVNVARNTDDKLERHEYRERLVGEQLKKGMVNIDKRIKMLDPLKGTVSRLDERLAAVETILMQKDERERMQLQKTYEAVLDIQRNLPLIVDQLKQTIIERTFNEPPAQITEPMMTKGDFEKMEKEMLGRMDKVTNTISKMENELNRLKEDNKHLNEINNKSSENLEKVKRHLDTSEQLLARYENKLAEYNNKIPERPVIDNKEQDAWKNNFLKALETQKSQVKEVLNDVKNLNQKLTEIPNKHDIDAAKNITLNKLDTIRYEALSSPNATAQILFPILEDLGFNINGTHQDTVRNIGEISEIIATLAESFSTNYGKIRSEIQALSKVEQVMVQTADSVLDTKRRVEYGVHQILAEVTKKMKENTKDINDVINERFDNFELSVLDEDSGALANLTSKIGEDIQQVWRQIGIMHQQMSATSDTLHRLENQTDAYVNGSLDTMDSMKGKVGQITTRMSEVKENLNYLLGRLSLVTQEFNQIKAGLGDALDQIRDSFHVIRDKVKDKAPKGPGPHKIEDEDNDVKTN